ncbi:hypothetical protein CANMA_005323 [Candida margitis]|uniref:uncharacterized protein n=1 Tax=Candida margitis TaxID=1775924 RepID=UPI002227E352|nr:uncharacterized protein CANMA_005323 [Candida margitis]KAI5950395.1 hypothetical protein CANMA_005323 [Candida margitis]
MEGIENHYPDNRAYQQIISTKKGILPLQETSTNTISSNSMLRNNKSLTSPVKPTTDQLNWKKRGATSPMPALTWHNSRRKLTKTSSIKADEENIPPIKQLRDNLNLEKPIDNDKTSHGIQSTHPVQQIKTTDDNTAFAVWPPKSLIEVELHRKLYLAEHRAKHYEELSEFLVLERRFQIEAGELSQSLAPHN